MTLIHFGKPRLLKHRYCDTAWLLPSKRMIFKIFFFQFLFCIAWRSEYKDFQTKILVLFELRIQAGMILADICCTQLCEKFI